MTLPLRLTNKHRIYRLELDDISTESSCYVAAGGRGKVVAVYTVLHGAITTANGTLTPKINGVAMTKGTKSVSSAAVSAGGTGYAVGDLLVLAGGRSGSSNAPRLAVATLSGSAVATVTVDRAGDYSETPSNPVGVVMATPPSGSGATFTLTMVANTATITVTQASSAAGDVDSCFPTGSNTFQAGDYLELATDGTADTTARISAIFVTIED